jgi:hypothetical protein
VIGNSARPVIRFERLCDPLYLCILHRVGHEYLDRICDVNEVLIRTRTTPHLWERRISKPHQSEQFWFLVTLQLLPTDGDLLWTTQYECASLFSVVIESKLPDMACKCPCHHRHLEPELIISRVTVHWAYRPLAVSIWVMVPFQMGCLNHWGLW